MKIINIPELDIPRIVVIGSGFAGLQFVKTLNSKHYQIVLLDKNNYHTFQPLLYQVATSGLEPDSVVYPIRKVFEGKKKFHYRLCEVTEINTSAQLVTTSIGNLKYDHLVIATGAISNFFGKHQIEKHALAMKNLVEALNLRSIILQNFESALNTTDLSEREALMNFVIVGAGPTGVELSGALSELKNHILPKDYPDLDIRVMQIHLIEGADRVLSDMSPESSKRAKKFLQNMGVNVWLNTMVEDYDGLTVKTNKKEFTSKTVIWSAGVKGAPLVKDDVELNSSDRIITDEYNKVKSLNNVYAIGDVACIESFADGAGHPMLASVAEQQGRHLAKNFYRLAKNKKILPFIYNDKGTMATVGRNKAVVDLSFIKFGGFVAWLVWMFLHLMLLVSFRNRMVVFINWTWNYFNYDKGNRLIVREIPREEKETTIKKELSV